MSFQNKDFWMSKAPVGDGEIAYDNSSRSEPKRSNHWFMDDTEAELFLNKKQAVDVPYPSSFTELLNSNICPWGNPSGLHSVTGQFTERLFDNETAQTTNFDEFGNDSTFGVSSLQNLKSGITYSGIKKVKVDQVKDAENFASASLEHDFSTGDNGTMSTGEAYSKADDDSITTGLPFDRGHESMELMADTFNMIGSNFRSTDRFSNKEDTNEAYREDNGPISIRPSVSKDDSSITTMTPSFIKEDENYIAAGTFDEQSNDLLMEQIFNGRDDYKKSMVKTDSSGLTTRQSFSKGENNIISFGGLYDEDNVNPSGRLVCSYDFSMGQPSSRRLEELSEKGMSEVSNDALVGGVQVTVLGDTISKRKGDQKATKKASPNNFPSNVRSLLSTGMLDGVPVKYVAWSREKELRGVIKGSAILCGCQSCTFSKAINAYEFERHAGCKTKHPNNHIYFENGKTIYGVVQRLRNTPQNFLFEVIQTITGSPINQKSFQIWKESFLAATHELQPIYGNEEAKYVS